MESLAPFKKEGYIAKKVPRDVGTCLAQYRRKEGTHWVCKGFKIFAFWAGPGNAPASLLNPTPTTAAATAPATAEQQQQQRRWLYVPQCRYPVFVHTRLD